MIARRLSSALLLLSLLDPLGTLAASLKTAHECSDHACACRRGARPAMPPCHGEDDAAAGMRAACSHETDVVLLRATAPALVPRMSGT